MKLTYEQVKNLPNGTKFKIFLSGTAWNEDLGKTFNVMKFEDKVYLVKDFFDIDDFRDESYEGDYDEYEDFTIDVAITKKEWQKAQDLKRIDCCVKVRQADSNEFKQNYGVNYESTYFD